jgi:hypothetical protein
MAAPPRPTPPPSRGFLDDLFPVNPLEVASGLYGFGTEAAGNAAAYAASHTPLDFLSPGPATNTGVQSSADRFGRDVTAMLDSPSHHVGPSAAAAAAAAVPIAAAGAKLLPEAETVASTIAKRAPESMAVAPTEAAPSIVAYHGSPHSFDRFDMSKIGTGEGAQAYGHGLYFAENEGVAKQYRDQLAKGFADKQGNPLPQETQNALEYIQPKFKASGDYSAGLQDAISRMQDQADFYRRQYGPGPNLYDSAAERLKAVDPNNLKPAGSMYQVSINANPDQFLDWDKPLSEQSEAVRNLADARGIPVERTMVIPKDPYNPYAQEKTITYETSGRQMYEALRDRGQWNDAATSQALADAGVPGIKYLDQGSRTSQPLQILSPDQTTHGQWLVKQIPNGTVFYRGDDEAAARQAFSDNYKPPSSNYVMFGDDTIDILRKYGLAGLGLTAGAGAIAAGGQPTSPAEAGTLPLTTSDQPTPPQPIGSSPAYDDWWKQLQAQQFTAAQGQQ